MDLFEAIRRRHSYRGKYGQTGVPREHLRAIMDAGLRAPSGCNKQTTHVVGVDDPALIAELNAMVGKSGFSAAPAAVVVLTHVVPGTGGKLYHVQDYSAAIENMLLAIAALGYASCWIEGHVRYHEDIAARMAEALGAPEEYSVVAYLPVGVPAEPVREVEKLPFERRSGFNKFAGE